MGMPRRLRPADAVAVLLCIAGIALAVQAWRAGSLFRYVLAGLVLGACLCVPLLTILLFRDRARRFLRRVAFALVPLVAVLLVLELGLWLFGPARELPCRVLADARLGHVLAPGPDGTDSNGFRNASACERADVLIVGDSLTWGYRVAHAETFAAVFGASSRLRTYQMANGSYGPVQYRELVRRGLRLQPRLVVVALYFGNDLVDAYDYAGLEGADDLRTADTTYVVRELPREVDDAPNWTMAFVDSVLACSRVLDFAAAAVKARLQGGMLYHEPGAVPFEHECVPTVLKPDYRRPLVDLTGVRVRDGVSISGRCLADLARQCREAGARCLLLALPTKEFCYQQWQIGRGSPLPRLEALHAAEAAARDEVFALATAAGMEIADCAPACVAALAAGTPIWPRSGDGHLNAAGHREAARVLERCWASK